MDAYLVEIPDLGDDRYWYFREYDKLKDVDISYNYFNYLVGLITIALHWLKLHGIFLYYAFFSRYMQIIFL